jgi:hypothetical protein
MDKNRFNREVRPCLVVIPIGTQGVAFDRLDLDAWADEHKRRNGCPAAHLRSKAAGSRRVIRGSPGLAGAQEWTDHDALLGA